MTMSVRSSIYSDVDISRLKFETYIPIGAIISVSKLYILNVNIKVYQSLGFHKIIKGLLNNKNKNINK